VTRIVPEGWGRDYGVTGGFDAAEPPEPGEVSHDVEVAVADWAPRSPDPAVTGCDRVLFLDGVRQIDSFVRLVDDYEGTARPGILASFAAGAMLCVVGEPAQLVVQDRGRVLAGPPGVVRLEVPGVGVYEPALTAEGADLETLRLAVQERLAALEVRLADELELAVDLTVIDGPLSQRTNIAGSVGYVKTHRVRYLDAELEKVVAALEPGQRTPMFRTSGRSGYARLSWYLRLPHDAGPLSHPWTGVVRCEIATDITLEDAVVRADRISACLPRFASRPHRDPRAPQNLVPIGALERRLRHDLGNPPVVERALRLATLRPSSERSAPI
jgi:uncharacterized protein